MNLWLQRIYICTESYLKPSLVIYWHCPVWHIWPRLHIDSQWQEKIIHFQNTIWAHSFLPGARWCDPFVWHLFLYGEVLLTVKILIYHNFRNIMSVCAVFMWHVLCYALCMYLPGGMVCISSLWIICSDARLADSGKVMLTDLTDVWWRGSDKCTQAAG